jgi:hypothetical protein
MKKRVPRKAFKPCLETKKLITTLLPYHRNTARDIAESAGLEFMYTFVSEVMKFKALRERRDRKDNEAMQKKIMKGLKPLDDYEVTELPKKFRLGAGGRLKK